MSVPTSELNQFCIRLLGVYY